MKVNFTDNFNMYTEGGKIFLLPEKELVAEVFLKNYRYIDFHCKKDNGENGMYDGRSVFYKHKIPETVTINNPTRPIYDSRNLLICQNCDRKILKVYKEKLFTYAVKIICSCGADYDIVFSKDKPKYDKIDRIKIFVE